MADDDKARTANVVQMINLATRILHVGRPGRPSHGSIIRMV